MWNRFRLQKYRNGGQLWAVNVFSYTIHVQTDCWASRSPLALSIFFPLLLWRFLSSQLFCVRYTEDRVPTLTLRCGWFEVDGLSSGESGVSLLALRAWLGRPELILAILHMLTSVMFFPPMLLRRLHAIWMLLSQVSPLQPSHVLRDERMRGRCKINKANADFLFPKFKLSPSCAFTKSINY
jgi:hypothetical protein